jgi:hypothetical protein
VSQLAEEFAGQVAFLGINNESMFQKGAITQPPNLDRVIAFVEEHQDVFRYTILIDNAEGFAKEGNRSFSRSLLMTANKNRIGNRAQYGFIIATRKRRRGYCYIGAILLSWSGLFVWVLCRVFFQVHRYQSL